MEIVHSWPREQRGSSLQVQRIQLGGRVLVWHAQVPGFNPRTEEQVNGNLHYRVVNLKENDKVPIIVGLAIYLLI